MPESNPPLGASHGGLERLGNSGRSWRRVSSGSLRGRLGKQRFFYVATNEAPPDEMVPDVDVGTFLGIGTTLVMVHEGADLATAVEAGVFVSEIYRQVDWDQILAAI